MDKRIRVTGLMCLAMAMAGVAYAEEGDDSSAAGEAYRTERPRQRNLTPEGRAERREQLRKMTPEERRAYRSRFDRDHNPPGRRGGPGTNWENPPGRRGGAGASPDRRRYRARRR